MRFCLLGASNAINPNAIPSHIIKQWQDLGLITYLGESSDVRPFIAKASCIVLPSYYKEGVPRCLLEALAMGKPIITTINNGCTQLVSNRKDSMLLSHSFIKGDNGFLSLPKNAISLRNALKAFIISDKQTLSNNALNEARLYSIDRVICTYRDKIISLFATNAKSIDSESTNSESTPKQTPKKKLCFVSNTCFGMYNFRLKVLQSLRENYEIHIIAPFDSTTEKLVSEGFFVYDIFIDSKSTNIIYDMRFFISLYKIIGKIKPDLMFNYTIKPVIYGSILANYRKIPNISVITGLGYVFIKGGIYKKILKAIVSNLYRFALKNTDEVWFLNDDDRAEFLSLRLIKDAQAFMLHSEGVDLEYFKPDFTPNVDFTPQNKEQESYLNAPDDEIVFLLISRMLYDKGIVEFVEAAKMLIGGGES